MSEQLESNISAKEAAKLLGISRPLLVRYSLPRDGKPALIGSYKIGARRVYGRHHLDAFLRMHEENTGDLVQQETVGNSAAA